MRAEQVSITDHALLRWNERVSKSGNCHVSEIIETIKKSKIIKKNEIIPYLTGRRPNTVYSLYENILFILEPISIDEFKLITVITNSSQSIEEIQNFDVLDSLTADLSAILAFADEPKFSSLKEENEWLIFKKKQIEFEISNEIRGSYSRRELVSQVKKIEERIFLNKQKKEAGLSIQETNVIAEQLRQLNAKIDKLLVRSEAHQNMLCQLSLKIENLESVSLN